MKIGIIGAGLIGKTLATKFCQNSHKVLLSDAKGTDEIVDFTAKIGAEAVEFDVVIKDIDVLILAIPLIRIPELAKNLKGKLDDNVVVIETTNYWPHRDGIIDEIENGMVNSVWVKKQLGRSVVKAFSNINAYSLSVEGKPKDSNRRIALAVSGDIQEEIELVMKLVNDTGFDALNAGTLEDSWRQQASGPAYCTDLNLEDLAKARQSSVRETLKEKQMLSFNKLQDLGQEFFNILISGNYPDDFIDHAVDINREINGLPNRKLHRL